jgi:hypothetical protein
MEREQWGTNARLKCKEVVDLVEGFSQDCDFWWLEFTVWGRVWSVESM